MLGRGSHSSWILRRMLGDDLRERIFAADGGYLAMKRNAPRDDQLHLCTGARAPEESGCHFVSLSSLYLKRTRSGIVRLSAV
jgi:hypothetical protein